MIMSRKKKKKRYEERERKVEEAKPEEVWEKPSFPITKTRTNEET